jgi:hypothetical protein
VIPLQSVLAAQADFARDSLLYSYGTDVYPARYLPTCGPVKSWLLVGMRVVGFAVVGVLVGLDNNMIIVTNEERVEREAQKVS